MPGVEYSGVASWLLESGIVADTPCLVISKASQRDQAMCPTTLGRLASRTPLPSPALLIVGRVASQVEASTSSFSWLLDAMQQAAEGNAIS